MTSDISADIPADRGSGRAAGRLRDCPDITPGQRRMTAVYAPETSVHAVRVPLVQPCPEGGSGRSTVPAAPGRAPVPRTGHRQLAQIRRSLSDRDFQVLESLRQHPFLTTGQITRWHFAGHASADSGARVARRVLARLADHRAIEHLPRRVGGFQSGSATSVWRLGPVGERLAEHRLPSQPVRRRRKQPGLHHLEHSLLVAEVHLQLLEAGGDGRLELLRVHTEPTCWRQFVGPGGSRLTLKPDLYAVTAAGAYEDHWFIEVDRGTESLPTLLRKCSQYEDCRRAGQEQQTTGVFPWVLWLHTAQSDASRLTAAIAASPTLDRNLFRVTTTAGLVLAVQGGDK